MNLVFSTRLPRIGLAALVLVGAAVAAPRFAAASNATVTFDAPTISVTNVLGGVTTSDNTGYFDVTVSDSAAGDSMAQFQASLSLNQGLSNVTITGADLGQLTNPYAAATAPNDSEYNGADGIGQAAGSSPNLIDTYVLNGNSSEVSASGFPYSDTTDADNSDLTNSGLSAMAQNAVYSLEQVYYDIPAGTPVGSYALVWDTNGYANDSGSNFIDLVSNSGTAAYALPGSSINGALVVALPSPEPSSIVLMLLGVIGLVGFGWRRARRA